MSREPESGLQNCVIADRKTAASPRREITLSTLTRLTILCALSVLPGSEAFPQSRPPAVYVDKGACPFECCTYKEWKTNKTTVAYAKPEMRSRVVGKFMAGSRVVALTGEVRTIPSKFTVTKAHGKYIAGDVLWVYTPLGEGFYKVWFRGLMNETQLDYVDGPYEQSFPRCDETPECWGALDRPLRVEWWIKIKSADGWIGWTNRAGNFSGADGCG